MCSVIFPGNKGEARIESATMHTPSVLRGDFCLNNLLLLLFLAFVLERDLLDAGREKKKKEKAVRSTWLDKKDSGGRGQLLFSTLFGVSISLKYGSRYTFFGTRIITLRWDVCIYFFYYFVLCYYILQSVSERSDAKE